MAWPLEIVLASAAFVGHFSISVWLFNRLHAIPLPRWMIKTSEKVLLSAAALVVVAFAISWLNSGQLPIHNRALLNYAVVCWLSAVVAVPLWLLPKLFERLPAVLVQNDTHVVDVTDRLGFAPLHGTEFRLWSRF